MTSVAERVTRTESQTRVRRDAVPRKRKARRFSLRRVPFYLLIALIFVYTVFPFYWAIRSALTAQGDLFRTPVQVIARRGSQASPAGHQCKVRKA